MKRKMKRISYILFLLLIISCSNSGSRKYTDSSQSEVAEDTYAAKEEGYKKGYEDGYNDGYGWLENGTSYNDRTSYTTEDGINAYKGGYRDGYEEGYEEGENLQKEERKKAKQNDWHNWDKEDVDGLFVYLEDVDNDEMADYIAQEHYEGKYIRKGWKYFAKIDYSWGEYKITLGDEIDSDLYQISGSEIYVHFSWGLPDVSSGDDGVLDWSGSFSAFYKKPNDL